MDRVKIFAVLALAFSTCAAGEEARWYVRIDNDVAFGTDRWYTSGMRVARVKEGLELAIVQEIYTPDANNWRPGMDDRAPAGRLLAAAAWHDWGTGYFQTIEFALGVRGPAALGRQVTTVIHHAISAPYVDWSRQIDNRFDAQLAFTRSQSVGTDRVKIHAGATLGNEVTFAHAGFELRAGDPGLSSAALRFAPTPPFAGASAAGWSAYAGASIRAVARNELISRNYDALGPQLEPRRGIARFAAGVMWTQGWGAVTLDLVQDAKEFDAQASAQRFGSLAIHVAF